MDSPIEFLFFKFQVICWIKIIGLIEVKIGLVMRTPEFVTLESGQKEHTGGRRGRFGSVRKLAVRIP